MFSKLIESLFSKYENTTHISDDDKKEMVRTFCEGKSATCPAEAGDVLGMFADYYIDDNEQKRLSSTYKVDAETIEKHVGQDGKKLVRKIFQARFGSYKACRVLNKATVEQACSDISADSSDPDVQKKITHCKEPRESKQKDTCYRSLYDVVHACRNNPQLFTEIPEKHRRTVIKSAFEATRAKLSYDIAPLLTYLPKKYLYDVDLMGGFVVMKPHYLPFIAPGTAQHREDLAILAYSNSIFHGQRLNGLQMERAVVNHLLEEFAEYMQKPLAVVIYPTTDNNSAFESHLSLSGIFKGYYVRYFESRNEDDFIRQFKRATANQKAVVFIIGGHGNQKSLELGIGDSSSAVGFDEKLYLDTGDANDFSGLASRLAIGAHLMLESCSNAKGGKDVLNNATFFSLMFPSAYVHASADEASAISDFGLTFGTFRGLNITSKTGKTRGLVLRKDTNYHLEFNTSPEATTFPLPKHTPLYSHVQTQTKLKELAASHANIFIQMAAKSLLGEDVDWGRQLSGPHNSILKRNETLHLIALLRHDTAESHWLDKLVAKGKDVLPALKILLNDQEQYVRNRAKKVIEKIEAAETN